MKRRWSFFLLQDPLVKPLVTPPRPDAKVSGCQLLVVTIYFCLSSIVDRRSSKLLSR